MGISHFRKLNKKVFVRRVKTMSPSNRRVLWNIKGKMVKYVKVRTALNNDS